MAENQTELKQLIDEKINNNGNQEIDGMVMNYVLTQLVNVLGGLFTYPDGSPIAKTSEGVLEFLNSLGHTIGQVVHTTEEDGTEKNYVFWGWTGEGQIILFEPSKITVRSAGKDAMTFTDKFKNIHYYSQNKQTGAIAVRVGDNSVEIRNPSARPWRTSIRHL